jgi:hypothetical protein
MNRRALTFAMTAVAVVGAVGAAVPLIGSLAPSERAKADLEMHIRAADIPSDGFREYAYRFRRVFIGRTPDLTVLWMPYTNETYWLPDPTWARSVIPCRRFGYDDGQFRCFDALSTDTWAGQLKWDKSGRSLRSDVPDMQRVPYAVQGDSFVVLGRVVASD